jgi:hypothetical protein
MTAEDRMWRWVGKQIIERKKYAAERTGYEPIGYLTDLKLPGPLPTFDALKAIYKEHGKGTRGHRRQAVASWDDFVATMKIGGLDDITATIVIAYRDKVYARSGSPKTQQHLFTIIRRILTSQGPGRSPLIRSHAISPT